MERNAGPDSRRHDRERASGLPTFLKRIKTSKILKGTNVGEHNHSINFPLSRTDIALVHTHPMPEDLSHLPTSFLSDQDIQPFNELPINAAVVIDRGGVHLLMRRENPLIHRETQIPGDLVDKRLGETIRRGGITSELIQDVASELRQYGLAYYFCPNPLPSGERTITFYEAGKYFSQPHQNLNQAPDIIAK